jgi:hypothetical protein
MADTLIESRLDRDTGIGAKTAQPQSRTALLEFSERPSSPPFFNYEE